MITQQELKNLLSYNKDTGHFLWINKNNKSRIKIGNIAGHKNKNSGYITIKINQKSYGAHRLAWIFVNKKIPDGMEIDHIDHNKENNAINNLRLVTLTDNHRNYPKLKNNSSGINGVHLCRKSNKWISSIKMNGKKIYLGCYDNIDDAAIARKKADIKYNFHYNHGSNHNTDSSYKSSTYNLTSS